MKRKTFLFIGLLSVTTVFGQTMMPYKNPDLSAEQRAADLLSRLTLVEKAQLMCDQSPAIPRLGVPAFHWWSEACHGYANINEVTVFPQSIAMAASFDDAMVNKVFTATSDEARVKFRQLKQQGKIERFHGLSVWTPNINIFRDPRWGRGQETYGEDPYLSQRMGYAVVTGLQGPEDTKYRKLLACAKHYAVHSGPESTRHSVDITNVAPRDMWETYMPAFKTLVQDAKVREVMCAYQRLDNDPCCGSNRLLQQILRDEWGFKYMVVSDCGAISDFWQKNAHHVSSDAMHAAAKGTLAGTDVECGFGYAYEQIPQAVAMGLLNEKEVDKHVLRLLELRFEVGDFDDDSLVSWMSLPDSKLCSKEHKQLALDMAYESIVLLQNNDNILPLSKKLKKIAVIGPNAADEPMLWGNYNGTPIKTTSILNGIRAKVGKNKVIYTQGCDWTDGNVLTSCIDQCTIDGKKGLKATYYNNREWKGEPLVQEYLTRALNLTTTGQHEFSVGVPMENFSAKYETNYTAPQSGELTLQLGQCGVFNLTVDGKVITKGGTWNKGLDLKHRIQVEKGKTYHIQLLFAHDGSNTAVLNFNIGNDSKMSFEQCINTVKEADVVVFVGGISSKLEGEEMPVKINGFNGGDRTSIELPAVQRELMQALKKAGKQIVLVNCSGSAMALEPETASCKAIVQAWYAGQEGGEAVADVLFGDYNPSGHLPVTFYKNDKQLPAFEDYSMKNRTYRYFQSEPLFPFGHGLSYTTYQLGEARLADGTMNVEGKTTLTVPVSNAGTRNGECLVQVYIRNEADVEGPIKSLKAFKRVSVKKGQTINAVIELPASAFEGFDTKSNTMRVQAGRYKIFYGTSSADKELKTTSITLVD